MMGPPAEAKHAAHDAMPEGMMSNSEMDQASKGNSRNEWLASLRTCCATKVTRSDTESSTGWFKPYDVYGLSALTAGNEIEHVNQRARHRRSDGFPDFSLVLQVKGKSIFDIDGLMLELDAGELILVDPMRPTLVVNQPGFVHHLALHLPRRQLVSYLGFEPNGDLRRPVSVASRLLAQLMRDAMPEGANAAADPALQMQMVVFDLLGALFAPEGIEQPRRYGAKTSARVRRLIEARFVDPELTPAVVAAEARISPRYLQKLFSARGTTCGRFILSLRLDLASRLLRRRAQTGSDEPLSDLAMACGFIEYAQFCRKFREHFGHPPSAHFVTQGANQQAPGAY